MGGATNLLAILGDRVVILGLLFTAVLLTVLGVSWLIRPPSAVERRLAAGGGALEAQGGRSMWSYARASKAAMRAYWIAGSCPATIK